VRERVQRVCVIGAGAIGSLFAGHLASVADVSILTRRAEHAAALERDGLHISGRGDRLARVRASADPDALPPFDLGIVATKADGLEAAAEELRGRLPEATIITVLTGRSSRASRS
jgi:2-dehydropantoate 2-reductase